MFKVGLQSTHHFTLFAGTFLIGCILTRSQRQDVAEVRPDVKVTEVGIDTVNVSFVRDSISSYLYQVVCFQSSTGVLNNPVPSDSQIKQIPSNHTCTVQIGKHFVNVELQAIPLPLYSIPVFFQTFPGIENFFIAVSGTSALIRFSWIDGLNSYSIKAINTNLGESHIVERTQPRNDSSTLEEIIRYLTPSTNYNIIVEISVQDKDGRFLTTTKSSNNSSLSEVSVYDVKVFEVRSNSFKVSYTHDPSLPVQFYTVHVHLNETEFTVNTTETQVQITDVQPLRVSNNYIVKIVYNTPAPSNFSQAVTTKLWNILEIQTNLIAISWTATLQDGGETTYASRITSEFNSSSMYVDNIMDTKYSYSTLSAGVAYTISVSERDGNNLFEIVVVTKPNQIESINNTFTTSSEIGINWKQPFGATSYIVIAALPQAFTDGEELQHGSPEYVQKRVFDVTSFTFQNLRPAEAYHIFVQPFNKMGIAGKVSKRIEFTTNPFTIIIVNNISENSIGISWLVQRSVLTSSVIVQSTYGLREISASFTNSTVITGLQPGTTYNVTVVTFTASKRSQPTTIATTTKLQKPYNFIPRAVGDSYILLGWNVSNGADGYLLQYRERKIETDSRASEVPPIFEESYNLTSLKPSTMYTMILFAFNSYGKSIESIISVPTTPVPPRNVKITINTEGILFRFEELPENTTLVIFGFEIDTSFRAVVLNGNSYMIVNVTYGKQYDLELYTEDHFPTKSATLKFTNRTVPWRVFRFQVDLQPAVITQYDVDSKRLPPSEYFIDDLQKKLNETTTLDLSSHATVKTVFADKKTFKVLFYLYSSSSYTTKKSYNEAFVKLADPNFFIISSLSTDISLCSQDICPQNSICDGEVESVRDRCTCDTGYYPAQGYPRLYCVDVDECLSEKENNCNRNSSICINTDGGYKCSCASGYIGTGMMCGNIDECSDESTCGAHSNCKDTLGSFECSCKHGFTGTFRDGCEGECEDIDECQLNNFACGPQAECKNTLGSYLCECRHGYVKINGFCERIDCENSNRCGPNAFCVDVNENKECLCYPGFAGDGFHGCTDINECLLEPDVCPNADCINKLGSFACRCLPGTKDIDGACIPQCDSFYCAEGSTCTASPEVGNPTCNCSTGQIGPRCAEKETDHTFTIVTGVFGGLIILILITLLLLCFCRRSSRVTFVNS